MTEATFDHFYYMTLSSYGFSLFVGAIASIAFMLIMLKFQLDMALWKFIGLQLIFIGCVTAGVGYFLSENYKTTYCKHVPKQCINLNR